MWRSGRGKWGGGGGDDKWPNHTHTHLRRLPASFDAKPTRAKPHLATHSTPRGQGTWLAERLSTDCLCVCLLWNVMGARDRALWWQLRLAVLGRVAFSFLRSLSLCLCVFVSLCLCVSASLCLSLPLSASLSLSLSDQSIHVQCNADVFSFAGCERKALRRGLGTAL